MSSVMPKQPAGPPAIADAVCIAALELVLKPLGTSLRHYMPASKAAAIEAMRGVLAAQDEQSRERAATVCDEQASLFLSLEYSAIQPSGSLLERFACAECAKAIRGEA